MLHSSSVTQNITLRPDVTVPLPLPANLELTGSHTSHKTLIVQASADIPMVAVSTKGYTVNATTTIISITTTATFHYAEATYVPVAVLYLFLQLYHSLQLQSSQDFTGTVVVADTPVAVLSGHTCVKVSAGFDFLVDQLLPMTAWGRSYMVPPNPLQTDVDFIYVMTDKDNTLTYNTGSRNATLAMAAGEVQMFVLNHNSHLYISAVVAVQVVFFFSGWSWQDPFLLVPLVTAIALCSASAVSPASIIVPSSLHPPLPPLPSCQTTLWHDRPLLAQISPGPASL